VFQCCVVQSGTKSNPAELRPEAAGYPSSFVAWLYVSVLAVSHAVAFVDRQLLTLLVDDVKADLALSDTQIGIVQGLAFAVFNAGLAIPIARIADRHSRRAVIMAGISVWSAATAACGLAGSFVQLLLARIFVAAGETSLGPASYTIITDCFPPGKRVAPLGVYTAGSVVGVGLSLVIGAVLIQALAGVQFGGLRTWQLVFLAAAALGAVPLLGLALLREPPRSPVERAAQRAPAALIPTLIQHRSVYWPLYLSYPMVVIVGYAVNTWGPTYLIRVLGLSAQQAGLLMGPFLIAGGVTGSVLGGWLTDLMERRRGGRVRPIALLIVTILTAIPACSIGLARDPVVAATLFGLVYCFGAAGISPVVATLQEITPEGARAQASAVFLVMTTLVGAGVGPLAVALITDHVFRDAHSVGVSLTTVNAAASALAILFALFAVRNYAAWTRIRRPAASN
jgi:MFS family permease